MQSVVYNAWSQGHGMEDPQLSVMVKSVDDTGIQYDCKSHKPDHSRMSYPNIFLNCFKGKGDAPERISWGSEINRSYSENS